MKCNEFENSKPRHMNLDNLDKSLHDLGMLSAITEARRDYLRESKTNLGVMRYNTRYVSNVTVGYCMKRTTHKTDFVRIYSRFDIEQRVKTRMRWQVM